MGRGQRTARERLPSTVSAEHKDFILETQRLGGSGKMGSCDNTFEMTPFPGVDQFPTTAERSATVPAPRPWPRGQPRGEVPTSMPWLVLADPPSVLSSFFYLLVSNC